MKVNVPAQAPSLALLGYCSSQGSKQKQQHSPILQADEGIHRSVHKSVLHAVHQGYGSTGSLH